MRRSLVTLRSVLEVLEPFSDQEDNGDARGHRKEDTCHAASYRSIG